MAVWSGCIWRPVAATTAVSCRAAVVAAADQPPVVVTRLETEAPRAGGGRIRRACSIAHLRSGAGEIDGARSAGSDGALW